VRESSVRAARRGLDALGRGSTLDTALVSPAEEFAVLVNESIEEDDGWRCAGCGRALGAGRARRGSEAVLRP
jgi:hypothetical protein